MISVGKMYLKKLRCWSTFSSFKSLIHPFSETERKSRKSA